MDKKWISKNRDGQSSPLLAEIKTCTSKDTMRKFFKTLLTYWGIALACVLIPLLHFVLVPGFFLAGIYMASKAFEFRYQLVEGSFDCPTCQKKVHLKDRWFESDTTAHCDSCGSKAYLVPMEEQTSRS